MLDFRPSRHRVEERPEPAECGDRLDYDGADQDQAEKVTVAAANGHQKKRRSFAPAARVALCVCCFGDFS
jgi:hypothetical protein